MTETNIIARFAIVTIGLVGNFISFLIFSRKSFKNNSINVYSRALAISDSIIVGFEFSTDLAWVFYKYDLFSSSTLLCKVSSFVFVGFSPLSGWILVAFSIDKLVNVLYPNRFDFIRKTQFQLAVISAVAILNCLAYIVVPISLENTAIYLENQTNTTLNVIYVCSLRRLSFLYELGIFYLVEACIVPFSLMIASSFICIRALFLSRSRLETLENRELKIRRSKDLKFSINSIALNVLYVCLQTPICLGYVITFQDATIATVYMIWARLLYFTNFSIGFFVHLISNSIFRKEIINLVCFKRVYSETTYKSGQLGDITNKS